MFGLFKSQSPKTPPKEVPKKESSPLIKWAQEKDQWNSVYYNIDTSPGSTYRYDNKDQMLVVLSNQKEKFWIVELSQNEFTNDALKIYLTDLKKNGDVISDLILKTDPNTGGNFFHYLLYYSHYSNYSQRSAKFTVDNFVPKFVVGYGYYKERDKDIWFLDKDQSGSQIKYFYFKSKNFTFEGECNCLQQNGLQFVKKVSPLVDLKKYAGDQILKMLQICIDYLDEDQLIKVLTTLDNRGKTPLHYLIQKCDEDEHFKQVFDWLMRKLAELAKDEEQEAEKAELKKEKKEKISVYELQTLFSTPDSSNATAIHYICKSKAIELQELLDIFGEIGHSIIVPTLNLTDQDGFTPLHRACETGKINSVQVVSQLLDNHHFIEVAKFQATEDKNNALHLAFISLAKAESSTIKPKTDLILILINSVNEENPELFLTQNKGGWNTLHQAFQTQSILMINTVLAKLDDQNKLTAAKTPLVDGTTLLHIVAKHGDRKILETILSVLGPIEVYQIVKSSRKTLQDLAQSNRMLGQPTFDKLINQEICFYETLAAIRNKGNELDDFVKILQALIQDPNDLKLFGKINGKLDAKYLEQRKNLHQTLQSMLFNPEKIRELLLEFKKYVYELPSNSFSKNILIPIFKDFVSSEKLMTEYPSKGKEFHDESEYGEQQFLIEDQQVTEELTDLVARHVNLNSPTDEGYPAFLQGPPQQAYVPYVPNPLDTRDQNSECGQKTYHVFPLPEQTASGGYPASQPGSYPFPLPSTQYQTTVNQASQYSPLMAHRAPVGNPGYPIYWPGTSYSPSIPPMSYSPSSSHEGITDASQNSPLSAAPVGYGYPLLPPYPVPSSVPLMSPTPSSTYQSVIDASQFSSLTASRTPDEDPLPPPYQEPSSAFLMSSTSSLTNQGAMEASQNPPHSAPFRYPSLSSLYKAPESPLLFPPSSTHQGATETKQNSGFSAPLESEFSPDLDDSNSQNSQRELPWESLKYAPPIPLSTQPTVIHPLQPQPTQQQVPTTHDASFWSRSARNLPSSDSQSSPPRYPIQTNKSQLNGLLDLTLESRVFQDTPNDNSSFSAPQDESTPAKQPESQYLGYPKLN